MRVIYCAEYNRFVRDDHGTGLYMSHSRNFTLRSSKTRGSGYLTIQLVGIHARPPGFQYVPRRCSVERFFSHFRVSPFPSTRPQGVRSRKVIGNAERTIRHLLRDWPGSTRRKLPHFTSGLRIREVDISG